MIVKSFDISCTSGKPDLHLHICNTDKFKTSGLSVFMAVPASDKDFIGHSLSMLASRRKTESYPDLRSVNRKLDDLYASTVTLRDFLVGDRHILGYSSECIDEKYLPDDDRVDTLSETLGVIAEMLMKPYRINGGFDPDVTESEKINFIDSIKAQKNDTSAYSALRCKEIMYKDQPYGISVLGKEERVAALNGYELSRAREDLLGRARIDFFYVGRMDSDAVKARILEKFRGLSGSSDNSFESIVDARVEKVKYVNETLPVSQSKLRIGFRGAPDIKSADFPAMLVFNELYGVMNTSRLFMNIREKLGLCYSIGSVYESTKGAMFVSCDIQADARERAERGIFDELEKIQRGDLTDELVESAKKSLYNVYSQVDDSISSIEDYRYGRILNRVEESPEELCGRISSVTVNDVVRIANGLKPDTVYFLEGALAFDGEEDDGYDQ